MPDVATVIKCLNATSCYKNRKTQTKTLQQTYEILWIRLEEKYLTVVPCCYVVLFSNAWLIMWPAALTLQKVDIFIIQFIDIR